MKLLLTLLLPLAANGAAVNLGKSTFLVKSYPSMKLIIFSGTSNIGCRSSYRLGWTCGHVLAQEEGHED
jgi:hypothetical protein